MTLCIQGEWEGAIDNPAGCGHRADTDVLSGMLCHEIAGLCMERLFLYGRVGSEDGWKRVKVG